MAADSVKSRTLERTKDPGIYKRGGRYVVVYRDAFGKQHKRAGGKTLAEAKDVKARLRADASRGEDTEASREKFATYAPRWIDHYAGRTDKGVREETRRDYRKRLDQDAIPFLGHLPLGQIRQSHLNQFAAHVASRGVAANTVRLSVAPVKALLADAFAAGDLRVNPAAGWRCRYTQATNEHDEEAPDEQVKALTGDELDALLAEIPEESRLFYSFLSQTGLRISEAIELRWRDVNLASRTFKVHRRFYRGRVAPPKSKYGRRTIKLSPELSQALRGAASGDPNGLVFTSEKGQRLDQSNLMSRVLKPAAVRAGIGQWLITPKGKRAETWVGHHTFRHTNATLLFRHGWNAKQVQVWLGHHSPAFTLATYVHLLADDLPELPSEWGNSGATQPTETDRNDDVAATADSAQSLGLARAV